MSDEDTRPVGRLLERLDLEELDVDLFLANPGPGEGRLFGGLVAAQAVVAAYRTLDDPDARPLHSLHAYFLRPGRYGTPIRLVTHRIRDGRTFTTRRVVAHQGGEAIFNLAASFARPEEGLSHQAPMPDVPDPEGLPTWAELRARRTGEPSPWRADPVEVRVTEPEEFEKARPREGKRALWLRLQSPLPDDPVAHAAALAYASDRTLLSTVLRPAGIIPGDPAYIGASLDHAMWFHHRPRFDGWLLYVSESPVAHAARGLIFGALFTRDGRQLASVAQEGLMRQVRRSG